MMVAVININIIGTLRSVWILRSRTVTQTAATSTLVIKPSAPEISREISFNLSWELGHHVRQQCQSPTPGDLLGDEHAQKVHRRF